VEHTSLKPSQTYEKFKKNITVNNYNFKDDHFKMLTTLTTLRNYVSELPIQVYF